MGRPPKDPGKLDEETSPYTVSWRHARRAARDLWALAGPCRCPRPHREPNPACTDRGFLERVEELMRRAGFGGHLVGILMDAPGGRPKKTSR